MATLLYSPLQIPDGAAVDCAAGGVIDYLNLNYDTSPHSRHSFLVLILDVTHEAQQHIIRLENLNLCMFCQQQQSTLPGCSRGVACSVVQCRSGLVL